MKKMRLLTVIIMAFFAFMNVANADVETYCRYRVGAAKGSNIVSGAATTVAQAASKVTGFVGDLFDQDWEFYNKNAFEDGIKNNINFDIVDSNGEVKVVLTKSSYQMKIAIENKIEKSDFYKDGEFSCPRVLYGTYEGTSKDDYLKIDLYSEKSEVTGFDSSNLTYNRFNMQGDVSQRELDIDKNYEAKACEGILGSFKEDLQNVLNIIKIVSPLLVVVLSVYDYLAAIFMKDDSQIKKCNEKLLKRLILCVLLFFLPIILNMLLSLIDVSYTTCIS